MGWCVPLDRLSSTVSACCGGAVDSEAPRSVSDTTAMKAVCFAADPSSGIPQDAVLKYCLDPATVLQYQRCFGTCSTETQACVRPVPEARLLRITVKRSDREQVEVIFYQGPKEDVWNDVKVGRWRASAWAWQGLPLSAERFWLYVGYHFACIALTISHLSDSSSASMLAWSSSISCLYACWTEQRSWPSSSSGRKGLSRESPMICRARGMNSSSEGSSRLRSSSMRQPGRDRQVWSCNVLLRRAWQSTRS